MMDRRGLGRASQYSMKRGLGLVALLIGLAVLVSVAATAVLYLMVSPGVRIADGSTLVLRPGGELFEIVPDDVFQFVSRSEARTVRGYVEALRKAKVDRRITAVLLAPRPLSSPFWGKVQELHEALLDFKTSGKPVYAFLEYGGDREYYLATAADKVFLVPTATLDLTGVATYEVFLRGTLDWVGTYPDLLHIGDYKTAINIFTEKTFTPAHREMSASLNRDQFEQLVRAVADGRQKTEAEVRTAIDEGPHLPEDALRHGLVDDLAYADELDDLVGDVGAPGTLRLVESDEYARVSWESLGVQRRHKIAVLNAVGAITGGKSRFDPINGPIVGSDSLVEYIRRIRADPSIRAIILRIDSPGGSSTASDVIWRELTITKNGANGKPIIVSMSDLAASGGYYIAMAGDVVVAQPGTLTGSIGIYTGKYVTGGSFEKLGANIEAVSDGRHAEIYSPDRQFTPEERTKVQASMQAFYDQFVEKVAEARQTTPEKVDQIAQGRVWTGQQAKQVGLVDQLGGMQMAVAAAKQRARIAADEEVELVIYPPRRSFYEVLSESLDQPSATRHTAFAADAMLTLLGPRDRKILAAILAPSRLFRSGEILAHMPYVFLR
jgi:protease IV